MGRTKMVTEKPQGETMLPVEQTTESAVPLPVEPTLSEEPSPTDSEDGVMTLFAEAKRRLFFLRAFIQNMMKEGIDYGKIPNTNKSCLFKSGAEKLCDLFEFTKQVEILNQIEDFDTGLFHYEVKVILCGKMTGLVEAEGVGSCNSREKKYRNQDAASAANTILKMAKKRALIDATLTATRSSDIFTQDMEDEPQMKEIQGERNVSPLPSFRDDHSDAVEKKATPSQVSYIYTLLSQNKIPVETSRDDLQRKYHVRESTELSKQQASEYINYLRQYPQAG